jgi:hypothetical protein
MAATSDCAIQSSVFFIIFQKYLYLLSAGKRYLRGKRFPADSNIVKITEHGRSLEKVMEELHYWGLAHRKQIIGK